MEFCLVLYGSLDGREFWERMGTCVCMSESLCCSPETYHNTVTQYKIKSLKKKTNPEQNRNVPALHTQALHTLVKERLFIDMLSKS